MDETLAELAARPYGTALIPLACAAVVVAVSLIIYSLLDLGDAGLILLVGVGAWLTLGVLHRAASVAQHKL